jgi:hypothetical protein
MYIYFKNNNNSHYIYRYIDVNIAITYFTNNKLLLPEIIYLINEKILNDDDTIKMVLKNNYKYLLFYENRHLILPYE